MSRVGPLRRLSDFGRALAASRTGLAQADRLGAAALWHLQEQRLEKLVHHALRHSPAYRDLYRGVDLDRLSLGALPPVTKPQLMARFDDWVTDRRLKATDLERHLESLSQDELYLGRYRVMATSGSTGRRGVFVYDRADWRRNLANFARLNERYVGVHPRLRPRLRVAAVGATSPVHISVRTGLSAAVGINRVLRLDARRPVGELAAALQAFQPDFLVGYPSVVALLAHEQQAGTLRLCPSQIATVAEGRTPEMTDAIRSAWRVEPFEWYGITEGGVLAGDCQHHQGLHLFEDLFIVEYVDGDGRPVPDGEVGHKLLLTNLFNWTQPLIRYELSDMVALDSRPCACGRTTRLSQPSKDGATTSCCSPDRPAPRSRSIPWSCAVRSPPCPWSVSTRSSSRRRAFACFSSWRTRRPSRKRSERFDPALSPRWPTSGRPRRGFSSKSSTGWSVSKATAPSSS